MSNLFWIACIVAIVMAADSYNKYLKSNNRKQPQDPDLEASLATIAKLEERIRVLERIVTESKTDLGREIDKL